jgi:hypothetical protein
MFDYFWSWGWIEGWVGNIDEIPNRTFLKSLSQCSNFHGVSFGSKERFKWIPAVCSSQFLCYLSYAPASFSPQVSQELHCCSFLISCQATVRSSRGRCNKKIIGGQTSHANSIAAGMNFNAQQDHELVIPMNTA